MARVSRYGKRRTARRMGRRHGVFDTLKAAWKGAKAVRQLKPLYTRAKEALAPILEEAKPIVKKGREGVMPVLQKAVGKKSKLAGSILSAVNEAAEKAGYGKRRYGAVMLVKNRSR